jgi:glycosyltransferase involved in cell wall biosynthesis
MTAQIDTPPQRIAIFLPGLYDGGAERVFLNLAAGISEKGYSIDFILAQVEGAYTAELPNLPRSIRVVELNQRHRNFSRTLLSLPALARYLQRERPIALLSGLQANIIAIWARRITRVPTRLIITEHNTFSYQNHLLPVVSRGLMLSFVRMFYPWADDIIAVSRGAAEDLANVARIPKARIQTIYNPIITPELKTKASAPLDHPWFRLNEPPVIVSIGRLTEQKDFPTLIHAFALVRKSHRARLLILGEGEERPSLEKLIQQLGLGQDVSMPGFVMNPYPLLSHAAVYVLSSRWEGLPTVLVEALYCNVPIVSTDCPSGPREILQDGSYGQLVPVGNAEMLAQAIRARLEGNSFQIPAESWHAFELETVINQYLQVLLDR